MKAKVNTEKAELHFVDKDTRNEAKLFQAVIEIVGSVRTICASCLLYCGCQEPALLGSPPDHPRTANNHLTVPAFFTASISSYTSMSRHRAVRNLDLDGMVQPLEWLHSLGSPWSLNLADELDDAAFSDEDQEEYRESRSSCTV